MHHSLMFDTFFFLIQQIMFKYAIVADLKQKTNSAEE